MRRLISVLLALALLCSLLPMAFAVNDPAEAAAEYLYELSLLKGSGTNADGTPDFDLEKDLTREQAVIMLVRLLGKEEEALKGGWEMPFTDVSPWAADYVGYAYVHGLTNGTGATTFSGKKPVTAAQYVTFVLRALGYSSETDFVWSSPWALSDAIGLTDGSYSAANNDAFVRGDMAIISADALDVNVKGSTKTLAKIIGVFVPSKEDYLKRSLTDRQLAALMDADLDTLRAEISTIGDAVAYLDQFEPQVFSGFGGEIRLDIDFLFDLHTRPEATTPQTYAAFAAWCITDDYDGVKYIIETGVNHGALRIQPMLALPVRSGYYVCSPGAGSTLLNNGEDCTAEIDDLTGLERKLESLWSDGHSQIFAADAAQPTLLFALDEENRWAVPVQGEAELVYSMSEEERAELEERRRQERIENGWANLQENWDRFGFPESFDPTLSKEEIENLIGKDLDVVVPALKTLGDVMYYLALGGYYTTDGDIKVWEGEYYWSFNEAPWTVFTNNAGNCGGTAAFVPFLLDGDYDEAGCLSMTGSVEMGGGHVITYIQDGDTCYVFDPRAMVDGGYTWNGGLSRGADVVEAGRRWRDTIDPNYVLIFAYPTAEGDLPGMGVGKTVYLPEQYRDQITIVFEAESEGYSYDWRPISEESLELIYNIRNPMTDLPGEDIVIDTTGSYMTRVLTDDQLTALKYADAETLQAWISTVADAVAYLDQFEQHFYSSINSGFEADIDFLLELHRREAAAADTYTVLTGWCLADDYPEIRYLASTVMRDEDISVYHSLLLPVENGYQIINPAQHSERWNQVFGFDEGEIESLDELEKGLVPYNAGMADDSVLVLYHLVAADAGMEKLKLTQVGEFFAESPEAEEFYRITDEQIRELKDAKRQERVRFAWDRLQNNWGSYGMPASMAPTMSKEEVEQLVGKDIDTVAAACKTLGDCLYYYALSGFEGCGGDLQTYDSSIGGGNLFWHYNYAPRVTFAKNKGNCGASSGLTAYLLQGDYDTAGMLGMTFVEGAGGGHFINYLYDGNTYYVFDVVNLLSAFHQSGFCFSSGNTLKEAADRWIGRSEYPVRLMWAYQSFDGDVPVGWDNSYISYLPAEYRDKGEILIETPSEGYVYQWVTISDRIREQIDRARNSD